MHKLVVNRDLLDTSTLMRPADSYHDPRPLFNVPAGYPSAAQDYMEQELDIADYMMGPRRASIFLFRIGGASMVDAGIMHGDVIVVDRALEPLDGHIVVACVSGEYTCKYYRLRNKQMWLVPANAEFKPLRVTEEMECTIFGVVDGVLRKTLPRSSKPFNVPVAE